MKGRSLENTSETGDSYFFRNEDMVYSCGDGKGEDTDEIGELANFGPPRSAGMY
ncbi:hypothetical protein Enr13x_21010 [Stieleria neptunia]|uniref:Uncharacterized protein n=1 Tax=Stieleria neptunia TaxID=2527979 RepID=A0A518HN28_9BACT|nr:hypothetical protein Enr13x_21010 [Stieleria neptunia]